MHLFLNPVARHSAALLCTAGLLILPSFSTALPLRIVASGQVHSSTKHRQSQPIATRRVRNHRVTRSSFRELDSATAHASGGDNYAGSDRKAAKLSIATANTETFSDLKSLIDTLTPFNQMAQHQPPIPRSSTSDRVPEEKRNVSITCWLYAAARENDNDFHLILGREPTLSAEYMTAEVSGLPPSASSSFPPLKTARDTFKTFFGANIPGTGYDFYNPPIPVRVEGSLFFDVTHATGSRPGPSNLRPKMPVIWEIHPITKIVFLP